MRIYPAVDLYEGKVVRLRQGAFDQITVYAEDPLEIVCRWEKEGGEWLHVVDLEGAKSGQLRNERALERIRKGTQARIQFGGGVRRLEDVSRLVDLGIDRIVIGTKALEPAFLNQALERFASRIAVALDVRDGIIQTQGWLTASEQTLEKGLLALNKFPLETLIYTDIQKDGMLGGPNWQQLTWLLERTQAAVILSGGIGSPEDIRRAAQIHHRNFEGIIIGKALYENRISLREALTLASGKK